MATTIQIIKALLGTLYAIGGTGLVIYLFCRHMRRGIAETGAEKEDIFVQNYRINRKLRTDLGYAAVFVLLMLLVFAFPASVVFLTAWGTFDFFIVGS
jgi:hypothetical protein